MQTPGGGTLVTGSYDCAHLMTACGALATGPFCAHSLAHSLASECAQKWNHSAVLHTQSSSAVIRPSDEGPSLWGLRRISLACINIPEHALSAGRRQCDVTVRGGDAFLSVSVRCDSAM
eukprot:9364512-Pyramimonas_sp.AAC.1